MNIPLVKLGDVCEVVGGGTPSTKHKEYYDGNIPWVTVRDMKSRYLTETERTITPLGVEHSATNIIPKGNIILATRVGLGKVCQLTFDAAINQDLRGLLLKPGVNADYLYFHLLTAAEALEALGTGATVKGVKVSQVLELPVPLPPLAEQERIVAHLERTLGAIDTMEAKFREMAETAERHFRATLAESFAALSSAPAAPLGEVCETTSGGTPLKSHKEYYEGGTIPWLRSGEVCKKDIEAAECFITPAGMENSSAKLFPVNTVLVAMYGATAGQVGILRFPATTNQAICGILPSTRFVPEFLYYALLQQKAALVRRAVGGAQPNISQEKIREVVLPLPSLAEQERVVARLERAEGVSRRVVALAQAGVAQCGVYRRAVLSEAFGGGEGGGDE